MDIRIWVKGWATFCIVEAKLWFTFRTRGGVENWQILVNYKFFFKFL